MHQEEKLHTVINLCAEFPGYRSLYEELGIRQIRLETADFTVPSLEDIQHGAAILVDAAEKNQGTIYVHCKGEKIYHDAMYPNGILLLCIARTYHSIFCQLDEVEVHP